MVMNNDADHPQQQIQGSISEMYHLLCVTCVCQSLGRMEVFRHVCLGTSFSLLHQNNMESDVIALNLLLNEIYT